MDPLTAIGLASAVIQFIDFGIKIAARLDDLNSSNSSQVPKSLQAISTQLPLLVSSLGRMKTDSQINRLDFDSKCILRGVVAGCMTQIERIEDIIEKISAAPGDSFKVKIKKVFVALKCDEKVWEIERNLQTYVSVLILHHVVDASATVPFVVEDKFFDIRENRVSPFVDRPDLIKKLEDDFYKAARSQTQVPTIVLVNGNKGVGKTQLVLEYCHQAHSLGQFQTVFWLDASSANSMYLGLEAVFATVKRSMAGSQAEKLEFVKNFLENLWHPWLLVLDNYEPTFSEEITKLLPRSGYGGIVLVSRSATLPGINQTINVPRYMTQSDQNQLNDLLIRAVQNEDIPAIKDAVNQGANVNSLIWNEWPVLHRCVLFSLAEAVRFLLDKGASPCRVETCSSALYWAAKKHDLTVFRMILDYEEESGSIWKSSDYQTAFNACAETGNVEFMKTILEKTENINLNGANGYGTTPLESAVEKGEVEMVKFLIEFGALREDTKQGENALIRAARDGNLQIVKILCEEGHINPNARHSDGTTALCHAAKLKSETDNTGLEMAQFLLDKGADPNLCSRDEGPLHEAALHDNPKMLQLLLNNGADITYSLNGWSPLEMAIKYSSPLAVTSILNYVVKPDDLIKRQGMLNGALLYAAGKGDRNVILQLLKAGADIDAKQTKDVGGGTALLVAITNGEMQSARLLIRQGARLDVVDERGRTALEMAARKGFELLVRDLVGKGADMNAKVGENEDTILGVGVREGHLKVVRVLLDKGVDLEEGNKFAETALDIAEEKGDKKIIALLEGKEVEDG